MQIVIYCLFTVAMIIAAAVAGRVWGRSMRRGAAFAAVMLGVGAVVDPPAKHGIEAAESEREKGEAGTGEPEV